MVTAALLSADQRLSYQVQTWLKELKDSVELESYSDLEAFAQKFTVEVLDENGSSVPVEEVLDAEDIGSGKSSSEKKDNFYRLLIVDIDMILAAQQTPLSWAKGVKELLKEKNASDPNFPVKIMFMAFEGGAVRPEALRHESVDDLILKPLDRSVFLQKIELLTADKPNISPTFLFRQKAEEMIEAGKDAMIDEISDFAIAIRNPTPLAQGVYATIHCEVFGKGDDGRVIARVYQSQKHPSLEGEWMVRMTYFGLRTTQLMNVKKYLRDHQSPGRFKAPRDENLGDDPAVPFNRIAVIDMDQTAFEDINATIKQHYLGVEIIHFPSYAKFLSQIQRYLPEQKAAVVPMEVPGATDAEGKGLVQPEEPVAEVKAREPKPEVKAWTGKKSLAFTINAESLELLGFDQPMKNDEIVFGKSVGEWKDRPGDWMGNVDKDDQDDYKELIDYARAGSKGYGVIRINDEKMNVYYVEANSSLFKSGEGDGLAILRVELKELTEADWLKRNQKPGSDEAQLLPSYMKFDAIFIDATALKSELDPWVEGLSQLMLQAQIMNPGDPFPQVIVLADERSRFKPEAFRSKRISGFFYKPLDRKIIGLSVKAILPDLILREERELAPFIPCEIPAKLAKDVFMSAVSEYGLTIMHRSAFREGAYMRFFSPLLNPKGEGVLGRCSFCEKSSDEKLGFACSFVFFGTPDETLKRIRTWIREDYVHSKEAGG